MKKTSNEISDTPSDSNALTQGCSIEWGEDTDTPGKTVNLTALFQSPTCSTPTPNRSRQSTCSALKESGSTGSVSSISPKLATQPSKSYGKEKRVEEEVDYIFSVLANDSNNTEQEEKKSIEDCEASQTPKVQNVTKGIQMGANEFNNATLSDFNGRGRRVSGGAQIAGASHRKRRRQMMERKRLFHQKSTSVRKAKMQKKDIRKNVKVQCGKAKTTTGSNNLSSFDSLLKELDDGSSCSSDNANDENNNESKGEMERDHTRIRSESIECTDKSEVIASVGEGSGRQYIESIPKSAVSGNQYQDSDEFEDFDFDDDLFAAVDAAVVKRQTHAGTQPNANHAVGSRECQGSHQSSPPPPPSFSLERSSTLPTSNVTSHHDNLQVAEDCSSSAMKGLSSQGCKEGLSLGHDNMVDTVKDTPVVVDNHDDDDDDFEDFAAMDFEQIDQLVAQREVDKHTTSPRMEQNQSSGPAFISCARYRICSVDEDPNAYAKRLGVTLWEGDKNDALIDVDHNESGSNTICGFVHLSGEWYYTRCEVGDVIHLCSLNGRYDTSNASLPLYLNSSGDDDIVLIIHPDQLVTPTTVSEAVSCSRRAVLKTRYGSSGLTSKSALVGTMRHELFEKCLLQNNFTTDFAKVEAFRIVRDHGDKLIGAGLLNEKQITLEVVKILPNIQRFAGTYTSFTTNDSCGGMVGMGNSPNIEVLANNIHGTEEFAISTELGIKGFIDASVEVTTRHPHGIQGYPKSGNSTRSLMGIELKTGHNQTPQHAHMAQLALYTLALRTRYGSVVPNNVPPTDCLEGASDGGMLLYLNQESLNAVHVSPDINELKSLLNQRNVVASELRRASSPRGVTIEYDERKGDSLKEKRITIHPATPPSLPDLLHSSYSCERCYSNRECMLNAAVKNQFSPETCDSKKTHAALLHHFTGHLDNTELQYWKEWDRLIDLETSVNNKEITKAWLSPSLNRERSTGKTLSSLVVDESIFDDSRNVPHMNNSDFIVQCRRSLSSSITTPLNVLRFEVGSRIVISTDGSTLHSSSHKSGIQRHIFGISRGTIKDIDEKNVHIKVNHGDFLRISRLALFQSKARPNCTEVLLRLDKEDFTTGTSTLRQNLGNLFTADIVPFSTKSEASQETMLNTQQRLHSRISVIRRSIIHLDAPKFEAHTLHQILREKNLTTLSKDFSNLNADQKAAANKVMTAKNYSLIQGFPGTGKTSTIVFIARLMMALGKRVLITSYTHAAVDNILLKLVELHAREKCSSTINTDLVRVGSKSAIHPALHRMLAPELAGAIDRRNILRAGSLPQDVTTSKPSISSLHQVISSAKIIGVSALTVPKSPLLIGQKFDVVIVDEAGQISQPAIIGALMAADTFVLVGDHEQLPPLVQSDVAEKAGYSESMLKRLADRHPSAVAQLTLQYRMHEDISLLSNLLVYNGHLKCGNDIVRSKQISLPQYPRSLRTIIQPSIKGLGWLLPVLNPNKTVVFVNTDKLGSNLEASGRGRNSKNGSGLINDTEMLLSSCIVHGLLICGLGASSIGIISPYRAQVNRLEENEYIRFNKKKGLEVSTIDKYQGRDKETIILSMARSNDAGKTGRLLEDKRRLNVAFSRAKMKLIIIGSYKTLFAGSSVLCPILQEITCRGWVENLPQNACELYKSPN